jgi:MGT family glycosyltransferase
VELFDRWQVPELADELLDVTYLDAVPPSLQPNGPAGFRRVQPIRPAGPAASTRSPLELDGLPLRDDVVYLTLGTLANHELEVFRAALLGLAALPVNVIVTAGPGRDPGRLGPQPANVRVTDYIPQDRLLPHCRLVVSHGGAGTMTGALAHGLPQLVLPRAADQFRIAAAIQAAGAGLSLPAEVLTPDAVADDAARLLNQPRFTEAAQRIRTEFDTMPSADQVLAGLLHDAAVN